MTRSNFLSGAAAMGASAVVPGAAFAAKSSFDLSAMKPDLRSRKVLELFIKLDKAGFDHLGAAM